MKYILLVGVHGVGKTTLLENLKKDVRFVALSISDLIRRAGNKIQSSDKFTKNIANNQELWKEELANYSFKDNDVVILDGHFSLLNHSKEIVELPFSTFDGLEISKIILKKENPIIIRERLEKRDNQYWEQELIESFQESEENQALEFSRLKNIPIFIYDSDLKLGELKNLLNV
ncbi:ATP-binding protein [Streptococcus mitis]|uniref:ATP-binding protein n=1 Tax=Streptococcus mitis TaxID=28037 RepID=UPI000F692132|nr:ATP-binding protein [Streptococcus mitis]RSI95442.1 putative kinase [Streptococcus mitis]